MYLSANAVWKQFKKPGGKTEIAFESAALNFERFSAAPG